MEQEQIIKPRYTFECAKCDAIFRRENNDKPSKCQCGSTDIILIGTPIFNEQELKEGLDLAYKEILETIEYYIDLPEQHKHLIAIWIIGTYAQSSFNTFPYLFLNAMRGSAKTRTLKLIAYLSHLGGGKVQAGINETTLYRTEKGATLILDEIEGIGKKEKSELREYLNAGYKKGVTVTRNKKVKTKEEETYKPEEFQPYRPIAMANIWGMEEVLSDRCITLVLEKSANPFYTKIIEDYDQNPLIKRTLDTLNSIQCSLCSELVKKNYILNWNKYIKSKYTNYTNPTDTQTTQTTLEDLKLDELFLKIDGANIDGRNLELFLPLMILSLFISEEIFDKTINYATAIVKEKKSNEMSDSKDVALFKFIATQDHSRFDFVSIKGLTNKFREYLGDSDEEEVWLNTRYMGRALNRLNLISQRRRVANGPEVLLNVDKAKEKAMIYKEEDADA